MSPSTSPCRSCFPGRESFVWSDLTVQSRKIVLAASDSESCEYLRSSWRQMLLAALPARYAKYMGIDWNSTNEIGPDGQAKYVPHGLRVVEAQIGRASCRERV